MSNISVDYDILNQKQTPAFYASSLATRPAFGFPGRIFIDTDTPSSGIYRDTGSAWVQVADPGAGTTGTLQQVTTNGNSTTLGVTIQGIDINDGAGTGANNMAIGSGALANNTTGISNTAIGFVALTTNTTGGGNVGVGFNALQFNTTGGDNTGIGSYSLKANTTGNFNTALGSGSLQSNTTGANNVGLGYQSLNVNTTGGANTGIGYASLSANTTGGNNTSLGSQALKENTTASFNTAIGTASLQNNTTGASNTAIGYGSLNINTTGSTNTAVGTSALASNTTAGQNTAVGNSSMSANTTGSLNTAVGQGSMQANTTGQYNTAVGTTSLNTNTTGVNNTAVGYSALQLLTIGGGNVAIGYGSGAAITTGSNNYLLGGGQAITTGSNNTIIGSYGGTSTLANNIVLSDGQSNVRLFSDANGLIGINQAVGSVIGGQLDIHSTQTYALVLNGLSTSNAYTAFSNASVGKWRIGNTYNAGANSFDIYNIGTSSTALSFNSTTNNATFISLTSGGIISTEDVRIYRSAGTTTGYINFGSTGTNYFGWGGSSFVFNGSINASAGSFSNTIQSTGYSSPAPSGIGVEIDYFPSGSVGRINAYNRTTPGSLPLSLQAFGGNLLVGTTTDNTTSKLQVAGMLNSGISYRAISYTNGDTTPSVSGASFMFISNTSPTTITNFINGIENQIITLVFANSNTTINRSNAYLLGGLNFTSTSADTLTLINYSGSWYEVSRSVNS